jgi:hypothetical protein
MTDAVFTAILMGATLWGSAFAQPERNPAQKLPPIQSTPKRLTREDAATRVQSFTKHTNIALLVGIGDYDRSLTGLPPLKYPVPDITTIGRLLKQSRYEVALLTDRAATAGAIGETFREMAKAVDQGEATFVFYFAGPGFRSGSENFLATFGTTAPDLANQGPSLAEVQKMLPGTGAKQRMAFIDACRNNPNGTRSLPG